MLNHQLASLMLPECGSDYSYWHSKRQLERRDSEHLTISGPMESCMLIDVGNSLAVVKMIKMG